MKPGRRLIEESHVEQEQLTKIGKSLSPQYVDAKRICGLTRWKASERLRRQHRISDLVVRRKEDGSYVLAAFIYYYTLEQLTTGQLPPPEEWLELDFISGQPIARCDCSDEAFASLAAQYEVPEDPDEDGTFDMTSEYYRNAYNHLDRARIRAIKDGIFDMEEYTMYLEDIMNNMPSLHRGYFIALSHPD